MKVGKKIFRSALLVLAFCMAGAGLPGGFASPLTAAAVEQSKENAGMIEVFKVDWSQADDPFAPLPSGWVISEGHRSHFSIVTGALGESGQSLRIENVAGEARILRLPLAIDPKQITGTYYVEFEAGIDQTGAGWAIFLLVGNVLDFRVRGSSTGDGGWHEACLMDPSNQPKKVFEFPSGRFVRIKFALDADRKRITNIWVDDSPVPGFAGMDWKNNTIASNVQIIGTTPSDVEIYVRHLIITRPVEPETGSGAMETAASDAPFSFPPIPITRAFSEVKLTLQQPELILEKIDEPLFFSREQLSALPQLVRTNPLVAGVWEGLRTKVLRALMQGAFPGGKQPYIYDLIGGLPDFALVYLLTRDAATGKFLRAAVLDAIARPMEFWIHAELRRFDPTMPVGGLETAHLTSGLSMVLAWAPDLFTEEELASIRHALRMKGLEPCLRWLERNTTRNNWTAVMGSGAYIAGKVLRDSQAMALAESKLGEYLELVEADGSYSEQIGYFNYGIRSLIPGLLAMGLERTTPLLKQSGLKDSLTWMVYYFAFVAGEGDGKYQPGRLNFGDDDYTTNPDYIVTYLLSAVLQDGLGIWLTERYHGSGTAAADADWLLLAVLGACQDQVPAAVSPEERRLPLRRAFDNGVGVIRSSWEENGVVLGLRSGGAGRTQYSHDRPDRNALVLFAGGEYLLVAPGRASYRSPLRSSWDLKTSSHNTITFNQADQSKTPVANIIKTYTDDRVDYLVSEAAPSYVNNPEKVRRHVLYVKDPGYFVVWDEIAARSAEIVDLHWHMNNGDGQGRLVQQAAGQWVFTRPRAGLQIYSFSTTPTESYVGQGIMHKGYSYYPGDPNEGNWGSSIKLRISTKEPVAAVSFYTVLRPQPAKDQGGGAGFTVTFSGTDAGERDKLSISIPDKNDPGRVKRTDGFLFSESGLRLTIKDQEGTTLYHVEL